MGRTLHITKLAIAALCLSTSVTALSFPAHHLFERALTCSNSSDTQCGSGLPGNFCCPSSETCIVLASNTTALCCATAEDCEVISPITCNIQAQNVTAHPGQPLMTTNLTGTLATCGTGCCPFGYSCSGASCVIDADQDSTTSASTASSSSATSTATLTQLLPSSSSTTSSTSYMSSAVAEQHCNAFPASAVLVGFFPGLVAGALLAFAAFCLIGAHRRKQERDSGRFGRVAASVSDPIYNEGSAMRSDFLRKPSPSQASTPTRQPTIERVRSLFRKSVAASGTPLKSSPEMRTMAQMPRPPRTPQLQRQPSSESINIFADPGTARAAAGRPRDSHQTTFTDMMERADLAGLKKGEPFVPGYMANKDSPKQRFG